MIDMDPRCRGLRISAAKQLMSGLAGLHDYCFL